MSSSSNASTPNNGEQDPRSAVDISQNPGSAYYLHPLENPGLVLVSPALNGENYHQWSRSMKMSLISKNKFGFVNGTITEPNHSDSLYSAWKRANAMVICWIARSVSPQIAQSILWIDKASDIWKELKEWFSHDDMFRIADLQEQIASLKQGELSVSSYFTELKILWGELDHFRPLPKCTCPIKHTCDALKTIEKYRSEDRVIKFLTGLNESYSGVRLQLMLTDPLPTLSRVYSLVTRVESIDGKNSSRNVNAATVYGRGNAGGNRGSNFGRGQSSYQGRGVLGRGISHGKICTYCNKSGHTVDLCYKKHGYPPNFKFTNKNPGHVNLVTTSISSELTEETPKVDELVTGNDTQSFGFSMEQIGINDGNTNSNSQPGIEYVEDDW
ncbi:hypothetical protein Lal_00018428 [Lupinus albus]|nr:hypothetical protein Lal_00018428 [Lupinus albus]